VAIVRLDDADFGPGSEFDVTCTDGKVHKAQTCTSPMYDEKREIPRGLKIDVPTNIV
jgi:aminomethyltransferase